MALKDRIKELRLLKDLQQKTLAEKLGVRQATVSDWETGRVDPNPKQRAKLAKTFGVTEAELFGIVSQISEDYEISKIPLISWVHANQFSQIEDIFPVGVSDTYVYSTAKGKNMFALKIKNDCMEPEFYDGDIVIVKPNLNINNNDFVIIRDTKSNEATFKQYKKYDKQIILHPLNPKYKDIELDHSDRYEIVGKIVEKVKKY